MNRVTYGVNYADVPLAGKTVREVAEQSRSLLNLDPNEVTPKINGMETGWGTVIQEGDEIKFDRPMGGKGAI